MKYLQIKSNIWQNERGDILTVSQPLGSSKRWYAWKYVNGGRDILLGKKEGYSTQAEAIKVIENYLEKNKLNPF